MLCTVRQLKASEQRVFVRADFNVPLDASGQISDDTRIVSVLPTLKHLIGEGARIVLASHLGRPKGEVDRRYSLLPVAEHLTMLLDQEIIFPETCVGDAVRRLSRELKAGQLMLLENLRFHPGEETNDPAFSEQLARLADVYINDAFGTLHRSHASIVGMVSFFDQKGIGLLVEHELAVLTELLQVPAHPFVAIIGGAKVADKIGLIERLVDKVDGLILGGGLAYTFLKAQGHAIGDSHVEEDKIHVAHRILERAERKGVEVILPQDHQIADVIGPDATASVIETVAIPAGKIALDIGPQTIATCLGAIEGAKLIFWNGPLGYFENPAFATGTRVVAQAVAGSDAESIIGGGDSLAALKSLGLEKEVTHISTGGGASLAFLEGRELPGLKVLE